jgi:ABC-type ATPase involved in cell division
LKLDRISVANFKRVSAVDIDLSDIVYLVGGNNSGKSSILQGIHMAVSCAQRASELQQQVIAESSLRYSPTGDFQTLGNSGPYENRKDGSRGVMEFHGKTSDEADASFKIEIYKARNYHNVGVDRSGVYPGFGQQICDPASLFSVYVPGLAGVSHNEEMQSYASVFRKAAGGEANLVFRNIIRLLADQNKLDELESLLFDIVGPCKFQVKYDPNKDLYVDVKVSFQEGYPDNSYVPIDLSGTGVIQITQIISYAILFRPKLLLIDEPDSHLHPSRQALLSAAFARIVADYKCNIMVSTHSRHLISAAPASAKLIWVKDGKIEKQDDDGLAAMLLDIGALDQIDSLGADVLICTEDKGKKQLEDCLNSLGRHQNIKVISYNGVTNAASASVILEMSQLFVNQPQIVIHRDRDFLTDAEIEKWGAEYRNRGMRVFCPKFPDMESYYVSDAHVAEIYGVTTKDAADVLTPLRASLAVSMRGKFRKKRQQANLDFWRDGGSPRTEDLWPDAAEMTRETMLGKEMVSPINGAAQQAFGDRRNLFSVRSAELSAELNAFLDE